MTGPPVLALLCVAVAACAGAASDGVPVGLGAASATVAVEVCGDGFVIADALRVPRESFVLALRQRMRALDPAARLGVRVHIGVAKDSGATAAQDAEWIIDQLYVMGVRQVRYL